ncbi:MAG: peptidoglycan-associated lipoprotein Pal [Proteobacteria bacterium]|nr:peptidoglycan-associated lipoprotein Pal [Desulfobacteraceae bacterium]MBU4014492.1 peptidoglycan-associated lipoprotein Pal [Pseudomonadota bacterium]MBU4068494.1 peptidoglycan-associated lipoprotein Pal [Pseudomonadota bacterium]MBU4126914.1 peptidoglycan-associated lipoprotein Pal [Pseudomonadota bacterium]
MGKRLACNFMVFTLMLSFSLFLNACAKKEVIKEKNVIEQKEEAAKAEEKLHLKAEEEKAAREARLKEEVARIQREREEAARKEEAAKREAQLRKEFENEDVHFDFDGFFLTDKAKEILAKKVSWLLDHPDVRIEIEGHCDERGTNEYNMVLGEKRANSTMKYLITAGVKADRISTISYGEEGPLDAGYNEAAWAKNRRAHFRIVSD